MFQVNRVDVADAGVVQLAARYYIKMLVYQCRRVELPALDLLCYSFALHNSFSSSRLHFTPLPGFDIENPQIVQIHIPSPLPAKRYQVWVFEL